LLLTCAMALAAGCSKRGSFVPTGGGGAGAPQAGKSGKSGKPPPPPPRAALPPLGAGQVYVYDDGAPTAKAMAEDQARAAGLLVVDLGDGWAPFIFQDGAGTEEDPVKPNGYRKTFVDLANERINADGRELPPGEHNFLEPFGIPPTLGVLQARVQLDDGEARAACVERVDVDGLRAFTGNLGYVNRERSRREATEAARDATWLDEEIVRRETAAGTPVRPDAATADGGTAAATWTIGDRTAAVAALTADADPKLRARAERAARGGERTRAVKALQALLVCDGLLSPRSRFTPGTFDLQTHEALAEWERKNDIFGWGFLGGETLGALLRSPLDLDHQTFRRVLAERIADAAGIIEDGTVSRGKTPALYRDGDAPRMGGTGGQAAAGDTPPTERAVPNLTEDFVTALLASIHVTTPEEMTDFLRQHGQEGLARLRVAFRAPPLPPYYQSEPGRDMDLSVEIDRGDVWYDFPFDARGRPMEQPRTNYPHLTLFVTWRGQKIPLGRWRTTIGSWRSELHANGRVYYRYKNSDVGPRLWKNVVAGPVWIPPDGTPAKDLLTRKVRDRNKGPEVVVNTDVMGPGFQSAYGLVMAIHINRSGFDNQIRTHGSVDYTSIARRFSHGCHRLVNSRAVRLFDFVLRRQRFKRIGAIPLALKRQFVVDNAPYEFEINTRGYYYQLLHPIAVEVTEGRIKGKAQQPNLSYVRKAGVDYSGVDEETNPSVATPDTAASIPRAAYPLPLPPEAP
jgi:hypothetical protein